MENKFDVQGRFRRHAYFFLLARDEDLVTAPVHRVHRALRASHFCSR